MAIKMRRGADADFRPEKMQPGELAVTVDGTRKVYAAFAAGDVKELSSKEDVDKTIASGLQSLETSTNNKLQSLEKKASSAVDKISSENQRVQEELSRYEYYTKTESDLKYTVAPRKEASSDTGELKLTDADDGLSYLELQGNSEQYTNTANTNMLDVEYNKSLGLHGTDKFLRTTGEIDVSGNWSYSYYIKVAPKTLYSFVGIPASPAAAFVFYTKDKTHISGITTKDAVIDLVRAVTTPNNCEWMRISYVYTTNNPQMYLGELPSQGVYGAVDTPSPDYPSEVRSVGDIPKDVNGVEIRNLLDESMLNAYTIEEQNYIYLEINKLPPGTYTGKSWLIGERKPFDLLLTNGKPLSSGNYIVLLSKGEVVKDPGKVVVQSGNVGYICLRWTQSGGLPVSNFHKGYKSMITSAAEIDEYRPYIGENNGLVKLESTGKNLVNANIKFATSRNSTIKITNNGQNIIVTQTDIADVARAMLPIKYDVGKTYTLYYNGYQSQLAGTGGATYIAIRDPSGARPDIGAAPVPPTQEERIISFTPTEEGLVLWLYVQSQGGTSRRALYVNDLIVVEGNKTLQEMRAIKYQPYCHQITWIPLKEPLRKMPGTPKYIDQIDKDGNVKVMTAKRHFKDLRVNAVKPSYGYNDNTYFTVTFIGGNYSNTYDPSNGLGSYPNQDFTPEAALSPMFKRYGVYAARESVLAPGLWSDPHYISLILKYDRIGLTSSATGDEIKAKVIQWLNNNDPIVYLGIFEGSQFIDIYKYQIPAVYIETYDQETNVRCLNKVKPSDMTLDYKIAMSSLIKRLEALESKTVQEV